MSGCTLPCRKTQPAPQNGGSGRFSQTCALLTNVLHPPIAPQAAPSTKRVPTAGPTASSPARGATVAQSDAA